jgi:ornithine cyclodeaminase/alanine dehydrogenase-like protein (mu-crystallin family)
VPENDFHRVPPTYDAASVARLLPYAALIEALDEAFRSDAVVPERTHLQVEVPGSAEATLLLMPAWRPGTSLGIKIATIFPGNIEKSLPSVNASYLVLDASTGEPAALLDGAELTARRTAAASALASRYLSREDAASLLMIGAGKLAPHLVRAHATVRPLEGITIWARRPEEARRLAALLADEGVAATPVSDLEAAVRRTDIVSCATLSIEPLIRGAWLHEGQHLDLVGAFRADRREADGDAVSRADVYVDTFAGALNEAGDIVQAMAEGQLEKEDIIGDLAGLCRGTCPARRSRQAITLFKSVGTALEDLAAAELAMRGVEPHD